MKGLIKLTPESLKSLATECMDYMNDFDIEPFRKINADFPDWWPYEAQLRDYLYKLRHVFEQAKKNGDEIWLSQLSYTHMCLLKNGHHEANPTFIMNY